jgi:hypothetical protein
MPRAQGIIELRALKLKAELEDLKQERKEQARALSVAGFRTGSGLYTTERIS